MSLWHLDCSACDHTQGGNTLASVCPACGQPAYVKQVTAAGFQRCKPGLSIIERYPINQTLFFFVA